MGVESLRQGFAVSPPHPAFSWQSARGAASPLPQVHPGGRGGMPELAEELAGVVRSALAAAGGGGLGRAPSRLELRMACQDVVAAVQAHFARLEAAAPAALSFEVDGTSATDALNQRLAGLRDRPSSPGRAQKSQQVRQHDPSTKQKQQQQ